MTNPASTRPLNRGLVDQVVDMLLRAQRDTKRAGRRYFYATASHQDLRIHVTTHDARPGSAHEVVMVDADLVKVVEIAERLCTKPVVRVQAP